MLNGYYLGSDSTVIFFYLLYIHTYYMFEYIYIHILNFTSSWDFGIFREYWILRSRCAVYAHKGRTKKLKRHGMHGFALDQPSINGFGPINRSEKMKRSETVGNGPKQLETWSGQNLSNPHFLNKHFRGTQFLTWRPKDVQGETVGNSWETLPNPRLFVTFQSLTIFFSPNCCPK